MQVTITFTGTDAEAAELFAKLIPTAPQNITYSTTLDSVTGQVYTKIVDREDLGEKYPDDVVETQEIEEEPKAKRVRRTKAQIEADRIAEAKKAKGGVKKAKPALEPEDDEEEIADDQVEAEMADDDMVVEAPKKIDREKDLIPAFQAYAKRHTREKAGKILTKFGVKSVRDLSPAKYADVLKALQA